MRIWFDTEFMEDGKTIDLVSLGAVREDGATLYLESAEAAEYPRTRRPGELRPITPSRSPTKPANTTTTCAPVRAGQQPPRQRPPLTIPAPITEVASRTVSYEQARELVREALESGWIHGTFCLDDCDIIENDQFYVWGC